MAERPGRGRRRRRAGAEPWIASLFASAAAAEAAGELARAGLVLEEILRRAPAHEEAAQRLAALAPRAGRCEAAAALLRASGLAAPASALIQASLASVLHAGDRVEESLPCWERAVTLSPGDAALHNGRGLACADAGRVEEAEASFRRAFDIDPMLPGACLNLARFRRFDASDAALVARMERLLSRRLDPVLAADLHFALAKAKDDMGNVASAAAHLRIANRLMHERLRFDPDSHARAVDALIDTFDATFFAPRAGMGASCEGPLFIIGMPRSGTSLAEQMLAAHPAVHGGGERRDVDRIARRIRQVTGSRDRYPRCAAELGPEPAEMLARQYLEGGAAPGAGERRVTDKLPTNFLHLGLIALLLPGARIVHCRRDPRDIALSVYAQQFAEGHVWAYAFEDIAAFHSQYERLMTHWRAVLPRPLLELDYEELVRDPEPACRRLLAFCGLDWDPVCLEFHRHRRVVDTASNWQVRQPLYRSSVGRWRRYAPHLPELVGSLRRAGVRLPD